jgi:acyl carrier protein
MKIEQFIVNFVDAIEDESTTPLRPETKFRELESWDSLAALSIMSMIDDTYKVNLTPNEMRSVNTLSELFTLIETKTNQ